MKEKRGTRASGRPTTWKSLGKLLLALIIAVAVFGGGFGAAAFVSHQMERKKGEDAGAVQAEGYHQAYLQILEENREGILRYEASMFSDDTMDSTALCDLDDDGVPELIAMIDDNNDCGVLHIYTFKGERAEEIPNRWTGSYGNKDESPKPYEFVEVSECRYILFTEKGRKGFAIYEYWGGYISSASLSRLEPAKETLSETVLAGYTEEMDTENRVYYLGRKESSEKAYDQLFSEFCEQMDQVLLRYPVGKYLEGDEEKITDIAREKENLGMTYGEITKALRADLNTD